MIKKRRVGVFGLLLLMSFHLSTDTAAASRLHPQPDAVPALQTSGCLASVMLANSHTKPRKQQKEKSLRDSFVSLLFAAKGGTWDNHLFAALQECCSWATPTTWGILWPAAGWAWRSTTFASGEVCSKASRTCTTTAPYCRWASASSPQVCAFTSHSLSSLTAHYSIHFFWLCVFIPLLCTRQRKHSTGSASHHILSW